MAWDERSARRWLDGSWSTLSVRMMTWASTRTIQWFSPRDLPAEYSLYAEEHQCLQAALKAVERHSDLRIVLGYSFRSQEAERGIRHLWTLDGNDEVVDPAVTLYGPPEGYLGLLLKSSEIQRLAAENYLPVPLSLRPRPTR